LPITASRVGRAEQIVRQIEIECEREIERELDPRSDDHTAGAPSGSRSRQLASLGGGAAPAARRPLTITSSRPSSVMWRTSR